MTGDIETRLRSTLEEMAESAPLRNPDRPRPGAGPPARHGPQIDVKTVTLVGSLLVLIGTLVIIGAETTHRTPSRSVPAATTSTLPPTTTSLPQPGPFSVPNVVGLTALQAEGELQAAGLTNSIDNLNCPGSFEEGQVIGQNPPAGFRAASDSRVNLRISCNGNSTTTSQG
jgi:hypothetical protein